MSKIRLFIILLIVSLGVKPSVVLANGLGEDRFAPSITKVERVNNQNGLKITFSENVQVSNSPQGTGFTLVTPQGTQIAADGLTDDTPNDNVIQLFFFNNGNFDSFENVSGTFKLTYNASTGVIKNLANQDLLIPGGEFIIDLKWPKIVRAIKDNNTQITLEFDEPVRFKSVASTGLSMTSDLGPGSSGNIDAVSDGVAGDNKLVLTVSNLNLGVSGAGVGYARGSGAFAHNNIEDLSGNPLADATSEIDQFSPIFSSAAKINNTTIEITFNEAVKTNGGNPTDFTVVDSQNTPFLVTAQADGTASDDKITLTVADLSTAVGDLKINYQNNNNEISDLSNNVLITTVNDLILNLVGPVFTSGTTANFFENANGTAYTAVATDLSTITYSLGNTNDESQFNIGTSNGLITFKSSPDFEAPADLGGDNTYTIDVKASDGTFTTTQEVVITVVDVDDVKPTVTLSTTATSPLSTSFTVNIAFSENVVNFVLGSITVVKGTILSLTGSGANYSAVISPTASGTLTVDIQLGAVQDAAGNGNLASNTISVTSDLDKPGVSISSAFTTYVSGAFTATFTFTESVTGFDISDIVATNATLSNFAGSGTTYTATVTPSSNGAIQLVVNGGVALDAAGNTNTASNSFALTNDEIIPTVVILSNDVAGTTNTNTFKVIVNFSETVTGFDVNDIIVTNATKSLFAGSLHQYDVFITPTGDGPVTINVAAGVAQDVAGNNNTAAAEFSVISDKTGSTVAITGSRTAITNGAFDATFTFNESVTGFTADDVSVAFASLSNFSGSGSVYTATITPTPVNSSTITIDVAAGVATDAATNANTAAIQFSIAYDAVAPTVEITSEASSLISGAFDITATFSEAVTGFAVGDLTLTNGAASNFNTTSASVYTATITPAADGLVTVGIGANVAQDAATNGNTAATAFSITNDETKPTVTLTSNINSLTNKAITITATFSESVTGFVAGDLTLTNGTVSNFSGSGTVYTATITPVTDGTFTVGIAAGVAADAAGNTNTAATTFSILADLTAPAKPLVAGISEDTGASSTDEITNDQTLLFNGTAEASSTVEVFIGGTSIGTTTANGSGSWTFDHTATTLAAANYNITAKATDAAGNQSVASDVLAVKVDITLAAPIIASISEDTGDSAFDGITTATNLMIFGVAEAGTVVTLKLGSSTLGTAIADANGDWSFDNTGTTLTTGEYLFTATGLDLAGNSSAESAPFRVLIDATRPKITFYDVLVQQVVITSDVLYGVSFDEPVAGFDIAHFTLSGPAAANASIKEYREDNGSGPHTAFVLFIEGIELGKGEKFTVTLTNPSGITDLSGNPLEDTFSSEHRTNASPTGISLDVEEINENNELGAAIGELIASDLDNTSHEFSLVEGVGDEDNEAFIIEGSTLKANLSFNFETQDVYVIRVNADDLLNGVYETILTVFVNNVPEAKMADLGIDILDLGYQPLQVERLFEIEIFNEGDANLIITDVQLPLGFKVSQLPDPVAPLTNGKVELAFTPNAVGQFGGEVTFVYKEGTATISVVGEGAVITASDPQISVNQVVTYPNPVSNILSVDLNPFNGKTIQWQLASVNGGSAIKNTSERKLLEIDTSELDVGLYLLVLDDGMVQIIKKIMIKR